MNAIKLYKKTKAILRCEEITHEALNKYLSTGWQTREMLPWEHCAMSFQKLCFPLRIDILNSGIYYCCYNDKPYYFGIGLDEPEITDSMLENGFWYVYTWSD